MIFFLIKNKIKQRSLQYKNIFKKKYIYIYLFIFFYKITSFINQIMNKNMQ